MAELWDAYDRAFNRIDDLTLVRGEKLPEGVYHLCSEIVVKHTDGTFLLMRRDIRKDRGGMWELTAGGSALRGETPAECAVRELKEETGIAAEEMTELCRIAREDCQTLFVEFLCVSDCDKTGVTLQKGETTAYRWAAREEILNMREKMASPRTMKLLIGHAF